MKKIIYTFFLLLLFFQIQAQTIINGGFEDWQTSSISNPTGSVSSNTELLQRFGVSSTPSITKSTDAHQGSFAAKLQTNIYGQDTMFGYIVFGKVGNNGPDGGFPYTQKPDSITGWFKSDFGTNDSGLILVMFKLNGNYISQGLFYLKGVHSSYTRFSFPLNLPIGFACDTVLIGFTSSDAFTDYVPKPGSWLILDQVAFTGTGITQQVPNSNFELWTSTSFETPTDWFATFSDTMAFQIEKTTDHFKGNYAAKLITYYIDSTRSINFTTNGIIGEGGFSGGKPYNNVLDTVCGYYKYYPQGADTAQVIVILKKNGVMINMIGLPLFANTQYTYFQFPVYSAVQPDTMIVIINSSVWESKPENDGSILYIDELQLKSQPIIYVSLSSMKNSFRSLLYPNPVQNQLNVEFQLVNTGNVQIEIFNITGNLVFRDNFHGNKGSNHRKINTQELPNGVYTLKIIAGKEEISVSKFVVK